MRDKNERVICIYDKDGPSIYDKILEAFERYLKTVLNNNNFL